MKPIILVIIGAAMFVSIVNHKHNADNTTQLHIKKSVQKVEIKNDTETNVHSAAFWIDRLP